MKKSETKKDEKTVEASDNNSSYFYAVGRRKTAVARVKLFPSDKSDKGIVINEKRIDEYFPVPRLRETAKAPLLLAGQDMKFDVIVRAVGGGISAQAEAIRLGIARALVKFNEELKKSLKDKGFLTRDSRIVERKKPGLKKARRAPQWAKR